MILSTLYTIKEKNNNSEECTNK